MTPDTASFTDDLDPEDTWTTYTKRRLLTEITTLRTECAALRATLERVGTELRQAKMGE